MTTQPQGRRSREEGQALIPASPNSPAQFIGAARLAFGQPKLDRVKQIKVGPTEDPSNYMGRVINESAMNSILSYIETGKNEGRLVAGGKNGSRETATSSSQPKSGRSTFSAYVEGRDFWSRSFGDERRRISMQHTEIRERHRIWANWRPVHARSRQDRAGGRSLREPQVQRSASRCAGAHPFGGFNMSGIDSKSGGHDYLLLFLQAKTISEKAVTRK
jgi:1-pyrroline-5-carboxylate dehydrogenase